MTGPAREDFNEEPDFDPDFDLPEPDPAEKPKRDAWDDEEGVPTDLEDIAIVAHEAVRAYRSATGGRPGFAWMHQTTAERKSMVEAVAAILEDKPGTTYDDDSETKLMVAIVKALKS